MVKFLKFIIFSLVLYVNLISYASTWNSDSEGFFEAAAGVNPVFYAMNVYQSAFKSHLIKKYPNARTSQTQCFNLIKDYLVYKNLTNKVYNTLSNSNINSYCTQFYLQKMLDEY